MVKGIIYRWQNKNIVPSKKIVATKESRETETTGPRPTRAVYRIQMITIENELSQLLYYLVKHKITIRQSGSALYTIRYDSIKVRSKKTHAVQTITIHMGAYYCRKYITDFS